MDAGLDANVVKTEAAEDDDAWLYGGHGTLYVEHCFLHEREIKLVLKYDVDYDKSDFDTSPNGAGMKG